MTTSCCGIGALSKLAINGVRYEFIEFLPTRLVKILSDGSQFAIRGQLDRDQVDVTEGILFVEFMVSMYLTPEKMDNLLPIMGLAESPTDTFTIGDTLNDYTVIVGPNGAKEQTFSNCLVSKWRVHGRKGADPMRLDLHFVGKGWSEQTAGTFFTSNTSPAMVAGTPMAFTNGSMTLLSATRYFNQISLSVDYGVVTEFNNSVTATNNCPTTINIDIGTSVLYNTCDGNTDLWTNPMGGDITGSAFVFNMQRTVSAANYQTQFTIANVKLVPRPPTIRKNDLNRLPVQLVGFSNGATRSIVVSNKVAE